MPQMKDVADESELQGRGASSEADVKHFAAGTEAAVRQVICLYNLRNAFFADVCQWNIADNELDCVCKRASKEVRLYEMLKGLGCEGIRIMQDTGVDDCGTVVTVDANVFFEVTSTLDTRGHVKRQ
eukprot:6475295-Amphidinium_carterae.1